MNSNKWTRKLMTMKKVLNTRDDIERVYASRKGRRLISIEDCIDVSIQAFEEYIKKSKERLITTAT